MTALLEAPVGVARRSVPARPLVLLLACAAATMTGVDTAVVNVALPSMQADLGVGASTVQWVVVSPWCPRAERFTDTTGVLPGASERQRHVLEMPADHRESASRDQAVPQAGDAAGRRRMRVRASA